MAGHPITADGGRHPNDILVAIGAHFRDGLEMSATLALVPKFASAAGPVMRLSCFDAEIQGLFIHISKHQNFSRLRTGCDAGDQAVFIEFRGEG